MSDSRCIIKVLVVVNLDVANFSEALSWKVARIFDLNTGLIRSFATVHGALSILDATQIEC